MAKRKGKAPVRRAATFVYHTRCEWCGEVFATVREEALTCTSAHRSRWSRWLRRFVLLAGTEPANGPRGDRDKQYLPVPGSSAASHWTEDRARGRK